MKIMRPQGAPVKGLFDMITYMERIREKPATRMLMAEVGCYAGESSLIFGYHFQFIYCIDAWTDGVDSMQKLRRGEVMADVEKAFDRRMDVLDNFKKIKMMSVDAAEMFENETLDFVYIDADHKFRSVVSDIQAWRRKIKPGGFIGGHDYHRRERGVVDAVSRTLGEPDETFCDSSWIKRVRKVEAGVNSLQALKNQRILAAAA